MHMATLGSNEEAYSEIAEELVAKQDMAGPAFHNGTLGLKYQQKTKIAKNVSVLAFCPKKWGALISYLMKVSQVLPTLF